MIKLKLEYNPNLKIRDPEISRYRIPPFHIALIVNAPYRLWKVKG